MERPNTVAGLIAKREELVKLRHRLESDLHKVTCDIDHLDAAVRLFDPETTPDGTRRYATKHRALKGHMTRFVLAQLRTAGRPCTSREVTEAWMADRDLRADYGTFVIIRKRVGACLVNLRNDGLVRNGPSRGAYVGYELAPAEGEPADDARPRAWGSTSA